MDNRMERVSSMTPFRQHLAKRLRNPFYPYFTFEFKSLAQAKKNQEKDC